MERRFSRIQSYLRPRGFKVTIDLCGDLSISKSGEYLGEIDKNNGSLCSELQSNLSLEELTEILRIIKAEPTVYDKLLALDCVEIDTRDERGDLRIVPSGDLLYFKEGQRFASLDILIVPVEILEIYLEHRKSNEETN